jgi:hypothetical protein
MPQLLVLPPQPCTDMYILRTFVLSSEAEPAIEVDRRLTELSGGRPVRFILRLSGSTELCKIPTAWRVTCMPPMQAAPAKGNAAMVRASSRSYSAPSCPPVHFRLSG